MKKIFLIRNRVSGIVMGESDDEQFAQIRAKNMGPNFQVVADEKGGDGKVEIPNLAAGLDADVHKERTRILGCLAAFGIGGLVHKAAAEGWTVAQARQAFMGKSESELWGPKGQPVTALGQDDPRAEWASADVRAAFGGNRAAFMAYKRAEAKGLIRIIGN